MSFDFDKMYCGSIHRGDVVVVEKDKEEKAFLVLQDDVLNNGLSTIVCAKIKPIIKKEESLINEIILRADITGLGEDGLCQLYKIETISRENIIAKKGELGNKKLKEVFEKLDITLGRFR